MEQRKKFQEDRYRHADFLEMLSIKEDKLLKFFLKRKQDPIEVESEIF